MYRQHSSSDMVSEKNVESSGYLKIFEQISQVKTRSDSKKAEFRIDSVQAAIGSNLHPGNIITHCFYLELS